MLPRCRRPVVTSRPPSGSAAAGNACCASGWMHAETYRAAPRSGDASNCADPWFAPSLPYRLAAGQRLARFRADTYPAIHPAGPRRQMHQAEPEGGGPRAAPHAAFGHSCENCGSSPRPSARKPALHSCHRRQERPECGGYPRPAIGRYPKARQDQWLPAPAQCPPAPGPPPTPQPETAPCSPNTAATGQV